MLRLPTGSSVLVRCGESNGTLKESALAFVSKTPFVYHLKVRECFYKESVGSLKAYLLGPRPSSHLGWATDPLVTLGA